jgi:hypothetical protein
MTEQDRDQAAAWIRAAGAGAKVIADASADPTTKLVSGIGAGVLELAAALVEKLGVDNAKKVLEELAANPAKPITKEELDEDLARVKQKFGIGEPEFVDPSDDGA